MYTDSKPRKAFKQNRVIFRLFLVVFLVSAFLVSFRPAAGEGSRVSSVGGISFEKRVDPRIAKPGNRVNFTLSYVSNLRETAYNVTVYDWMPAELTVLSSHPFYDGASNPETGFYRWSRGRIVPGGTGTIVVTVLVGEVPVGTEITNTAHLAYELANGTRVEATSGITIAVTQGAGVDVFPDQIHSVPPSSGAQTEYNITVRNTGNALDTFDMISRSVAYSPSSSIHAWTIELFNSTGYFTRSPAGTVYDDNSNNRTSWTDHGVIASTTLGMNESTWFILRVTEAEGTSGSGDAFLDVHLIARSRFDPNVWEMTDENTIVKSVAGLTFAPDYSKEANPGDTMVFNHIIVNSGQTDVIDLSYVSPMEWSYSFFYANGTLLADTDGSGCVDVGIVPRNQYVYVFAEVTVPYSIPAGTVDSAVMTARGVATGNVDSVNDTTTVRSAPMLGISKRLVSENPAYEGDVVTYEVRIVNLGNTRLIRIPLDDTFETGGLNFSRAQPAEGSYDEFAGNIHWDNLGALEPGQGVNVAIDFMAAASDRAVRQSSNVIDAEDEFGNLVSATCMNTDLCLVGARTLTVTAGPAEAVGGAFTIIWIEHGGVKASTLATPNMIQCDEGTIVTIGHPETPITDGDARYVFVGYSPSAVLWMDSDKLVTLHYRTEYVLTFDQTGSGMPVYVTVNDVQLSEALPQSFWIEKGSVVAFSYPSVITNLVGTTRYVLIGISSNDAGTSVTVDAPTVVTGLYNTQYYLSVTTYPEGLDNPRHSGWYDDGTYAPLEVEALTGGDGATTRFRFDHWSGDGVVQAGEASTAIKVDSPKSAQAVFVQQFYLTMATNFGEVAPESGWYDAGSTVSIEAFAPAIIEDQGYVWHGWTGTGDGSYSDIENPAEVVMNGVIHETAAWKIDSSVSVVVLIETIANGDRIVVCGETAPAHSGLEVTVFYGSPTGSAFEHTVYTDDEGRFMDTLVLDQHDLYRLLVESGEWNVTVFRLGDNRIENARASTTLRVESQSIIQFPPVLLVGGLLVAGAIAFVPPAAKKKNGNGWRRVVVVFSIAGLVAGAVSLLPSWVVVAGTVATDGAVYQVGVELSPFGQGVVSINSGVKYVGPPVSSMVQMSSGPVLSLYLVPAACVLALTGLYKPKSGRERNLKTVMLVIAGVLIAASVMHTSVFVQTHASAIEGAGIGYGLGLYVAITSCGLLMVSALFATRENNSGYEETHGSLEANWTPPSP